MSGRLEIRGWWPPTSISLLSSLPSLLHLWPSEWLLECTARLSIVYMDSDIRIVDNRCKSIKRFTIRYINYACSLYCGCPLLRGAVKGGSTVHVLPIQAVYCVYVLSILRQFCVNYSVNLVSFVQTIIFEYMICYTPLFIQSNAWKVM